MQNHNCLKSIVINIIIILLYLPDLSGQNIDCCECDVGTEWSDTKDMYVEIFGLDVHVYYREMECNGVYKMMIDEVQDISATMRNNHTLDEIFEEMMKIIILENPMIFPPQSIQDLPYYWQFCVQRCWRYIYQDETYMRMGPCEYSEGTENCCKTEIYVHYGEECNERSYEWVQQTSIPFDCPDMNSTHDECFNVCVPYINPKGK